MEEEEFDFEEVAKYTPQQFDCYSWFEKWDKVYNDKKKSLRERKRMLKKLLKEIEDQTDNISKGKEFMLNGKKTKLKQEDLKNAVENTAKFDYESLKSKLPKLMLEKNTTTHFIKRDMIDVGLFIDSQVKKNPLILISSDFDTPGGSDKLCLFGMEVNAWRRSAIRECIDPKRRKKYFLDTVDKFDYSLNEDQLIYCPNVPVFRNNLKSGYEFIEPVNLSFALISPLYRPNLLNDQVLSENDVEIIRKKIEMLFMTAIIYSHHHLIISAFGCGKARNPPDQVSRIFIDTILKFKNYPLDVNFAIIDDKIHENNFQGNVFPFSTAYKSLRKNNKSK